jgi:hypothetical protein
MDARGLTGRIATPLGKPLGSQWFKEEGCSYERRNLGLREDASYDFGHHWPA